MMFMVQVPKGTMPQQVSEFPDGCERSKKGSLHFRSNSTIRLTEDEYNHVLKCLPAFGKRLLVVHRGEAKLEAAARRAAQPKKAVPTAPLVVEAKEEEASADKESKDSQKAKKKSN